MLLAGKTKAYSFPSITVEGRIYLNNNGNAADAWEIYDFGGTKVTTTPSIPMDGNSLISQDKSEMETTLHQ